jgi:hypothetical protein
MLNPKLNVKTAACAVNNPANFPNRKVGILTGYVHRRCHCPLSISLATEKDPMIIMKRGNKYRRILTMVPVTFVKLEIPSLLRSSKNKREKTTTQRNRNV